MSKTFIAEEVEAAHVIESINSLKQLDQKDGRFELLLFPVAKLIKKYKLSLKTMQVDDPLGANFELVFPCLFWNPFVEQMYDPVFNIQTFRQQESVSMKDYLTSDTLKSDCILLLSALQLHQLIQSFGPIANYIKICVTPHVVEKKVQLTRTSVYTHPSLWLQSFYSST